MTMKPGCPRSKWKLKQGNPIKRVIKKSIWFILGRKLCQGLEVGTWLSDARMLRLQTSQMDGYRKVCRHREANKEPTKVFEEA